jgi:DNA-binding transcriptional MerR regulator
VDDNLISKKELLEMTGISYGQLYRWKRKSLIPEEWFVKKSAFTGQETFFPRREVLARIERIKDMKDDLSLDELADMFSPNPSAIQMDVEEVTKRNIVTKPVLQLFLEDHNDKDLSFTQILAVYIADVALQTGTLSLAEAKIMIGAIEEHIDKFQGKPCELLFVRNHGIGVCLLVQSPVELHFDGGSKIVFRYQVSTSIEQLKMKLT